MYRNRSEKSQRVHTGTGRWIAVLLALVLVFASACNGSEENGGGKGGFSGTLGGSDDYAGGFYNTAATDDYGRSFTATGGYSDSKYVGVFYFLWNGSAAGVYDVSEFEKRGEVESVLTGDAVPGNPSFTYWGKPLYDYYVGTDKWVIRKHIELFIHAGIDFVAFDCSNTIFYALEAHAFLDISLEYQKMGFRVPQIMFMTNTDPEERTNQIYREFYRDDTYESLWFKGTGSKPWILSDADRSDTLDPEIKDRFYFKKAQWPNSPRSESNFPWMSWTYPQETFLDSQVGKIMSVSVAQHTGLSDSEPIYAQFSDSGLFAPYNYDTLSDAVKAAVSPERAAKIYNTNHGRGFSHKDKVNKISRVNENINFEEQWETALDPDRNISLVFVTGWNEWIAQKQSGSPVLGPAYGNYCDLFNREFSRDIEMCDGEYLDNCFLQLVRNVRAFKGSGQAEVYGEQSSFSAKDLSRWSVKAVYKDLVGDTKHRRELNSDQELIENKTGRNDVSEVRVTGDVQNVYFLIRTAEDITAQQAGDTRWMNLFIGLDGRAGGWNGLQFVVNRERKGTLSKLQKIENGAFVDFAEAETLVEGNLMLVTVKKSDLGIEAGNYTLQFKVCDNLQKDFDTADTYLNGDCAPIGRINYVYSASNA